MTQDPVPPERVELIKCEIKSELEEAFKNHQNIRRRTSSLIDIQKAANGDELNDVQSSIDEAVGDIAQQVSNLRETMKKKLQKIEISSQEKRNVMEAKLKKLIKTNESEFKKGKEKNEK